MTVPNPETPAQEEASLYYYINFKRLEEDLKRSAATLLKSRLTPLSPSALSEDRKSEEDQELLEEIAQYAPAEDGFIKSDMPIQEIIFRMLLLRRNEPTQLTELHHELTESWATPVRPITVSLRSLARILDNDDYYGFHRLEE